MCAIVNVKQLGTRLGSGDGRVSSVGPKGRGGGVPLLQEGQKSRQGWQVCFRTQALRGKILFETSSVNCGLQRNNLSEKVVCRCSNTIILLRRVSF